jgi:hypothetical protein
MFLPRFVLAAVVALPLLPCAATAQSRAALPRETVPGAGLKRTRLYLKDGTFQVVLSYTVKGDNVFYLSAERGAEEEIIPLKLVDLDATEKWTEQAEALRAGVPAVQIDPELAKEEADRTARSPEVAKDLHLADENSVLVLDTYRGQPQLAILQQTDGELNRQTSHNILRLKVNPLAHTHELFDIKGQTAPVQLHVGDPEIFVRLDDEQGAEPVHAGAFQVDTAGNRGRTVESPSPTSQYVILRVDVRRDVRVVTSFNIGTLGSGTREPDVIETSRSLMPGGHWLKIVPKESLSFGEYALIEVIDTRTVNSGVWDFGVRPTAGPNRDAILPQERKTPTLSPRRSQP